MHPDYFVNQQSYLKLSPALLDKYRDKWIAVADGKIVASGDTLRPVFDAAVPIHKHPYMVCVGSDLHRNAVDRATVFRAAVYQSDVAGHASVCCRRTPSVRQASPTDVHDAAKESSPEAVGALIELGADINEQDSNGFTGLQWAVTRGRADVARTLLELGADPNLDCPLFSVACSQHLKDRVAMAKLLLGHGADINQPYLVEDLPPRTALSEALAPRRAELIELLKSRGAGLPGKPRGAQKKPAGRTEPGDHAADLIGHFRKRYGKPDDACSARSSRRRPVRSSFITFRSPKSRIAPCCLPAA